jgi:2-oxoisovalerate dehydrogenase E2 component (dihydrolipoyl transacylase)
MKIFRLPDLGEGLPDAEIREWYIQEGDEVKVDQPMVAMETAKAVVDVPAPRAGRIAKLYGKAGDVINTGAPLVEFTDGEDQAAKGTVVGNLEIGNTIIQETATGIKPTAAPAASIKAIPAVRALAKKLNVDLNAVTATGANNQITVADVERAAEQPIATPTELTDGVSLRGVRRAMAITMAQSHSEVAPVLLVDDADIQAWAAGADITGRIIRAVIAACQAEPSLNAYYNGKAMAIQLQKAVHLGLAMDAAEGLFVPVIKNAQELTPTEWRNKINAFKEQVKTRTVPQDDLKGATIVLSNVGTFAGKYASPIIVPPTVAIIASGRIRDEVVAHKGKIEIHRIIPISLSFDHRAVTGGEAARFLAALIHDLQAET